MRRQCAHGTNADGAARSPCGSTVWFLDLSEAPEHYITRTEDEDVALAMKRAAISRHRDDERTETNQ